MNDTDETVLTVDAKPWPIGIDIARTALIVVDMQNDFGTKSGIFDRAGIDISMIQAAIAPTARVVAAGREAGMKVIYLKMAFRSDLSDAGPPDSPNATRHMHFGAGKAVLAPNGEQSRLLIRDTWNTDIVDALKPQAGDVVIYKHRFSGFYETELDATSVCVESTIRDAMFRDYSCVLLADCAAEPIGCELPRSNHEASLLVIQTLFGWVSESAAFMRALAASHVAA